MEIKIEENEEFRERFEARFAKIKNELKFGIVFLKIMLSKYSLNFFKLKN